MKVSTSLKTLGSVFLGGALVACLSASAMGKTVTITWSTWLGGDQLAEQKELLAEFERENPNIKVKILTGCWMDKLLTMFAAGTAPDVMHTVFYWSDEFLRRGLLLDATKYFRASNFDFNQYVKFTPAYRREGKIWGGLETHNQVYPLYYNATAFRQAGVIPPMEQYEKGNWNWNTYLQTAKRLTADTNGDGKMDRWGTLVTGWWETGWLPWVLMNGSNYYDEKTNRVTLDNPKNIETMRYLTSLINEYKVAPPEGSQSSDGFANGKLAMMIDGTWLLNRYTSMKMKFDWDIAFPPKGVTYDTGIAPGADGVISKSTKHPQEAFKLVQFFLGERCQTMKGKSRLVIPVMKKAISSKEFLAAPPANMRIIPKMIDNATLQPSFPGFPDVDAAINKEVVKMLRGQKSVQDAMKQATADSNKVLARYTARKSKK